MGSLVVVSGPSGSGKTSITKEVCKIIGEDKTYFSISSTTRPPREGEKDGVDYFFLSKDEFLKDIEIIDTPGIEDPVVSREQRTKDLLRICDVVFVGSIVRAAEFSLLPLNPELPPESLPQPLNRKVNPTKSSK